MPLLVNTPFGEAVGRRLPHAQTHPQTQDDVTGEIQVSLQVEQQLYTTLCGGRGGFSDFCSAEVGKPTLGYKGMTPRMTSPPLKAKGGLVFAVVTSLFFRFATLIQLLPSPF